MARVCERPRPTAGQRAAVLLLLSVAAPAVSGFSTNLAPASADRGSSGGSFGSCIPLSRPSSPSSCIAGRTSLFRSTPTVSVSCRKETQPHRRQRKTRLDAFRRRAVRAVGFMAMAAVSWQGTGYAPPACAVPSTVSQQRALNEETRTVESVLADARSALEEFRSLVDSHEKNVQQAQASNARRTETAETNNCMQSSSSVDGNTVWDPAFDSVLTEDAMPTPAVTAEDVFQAELHRMSSQVDLSRAFARQTPEHHPRIQHDTGHYHDDDRCETDAQHNPVLASQVPSRTSHKDRVHQLEDFLISSETTVMHQRAVDLRAGSTSAIDPLPSDVSSTDIRHYGSTVPLSTIIQRAAVDGATNSARVATSETVSLSEGWIRECHPQSLDTSLSHSRSESTSVSQLLGGGNGDDDGSDGISNNSLELSSTSNSLAVIGSADTHGKNDARTTKPNKVTQTWDSNPRFVKKVAFVAAGTAGFLVGKAIYNNWINPEPPTSADVGSNGATATPTAQKEVAEVAIRQPSSSHDTPKLDSVSSTIDQAKRLPTIVSNSVVAERELGLVDNDSLTATVGAIALGGAAGLLMTRKQQTLTIDMELEEETETVVDPPPLLPTNTSTSNQQTVANLPTVDSSVDDVAKQGWSTIFGAPNQQVMAEPDITSQNSVETLVERQLQKKHQSRSKIEKAAADDDYVVAPRYPLMTDKFIKARQYPKPKHVEEQLAAKYAAIESVGDRAFQILLDLGMIQENRSLKPDEDV